MFLNRYNDFIFESLIMESILVYSDDFKNILKSIDSPVAKILMEIESNDLTLANNYIDITDSKEEISFIADRKAQQILSPEYIKKFVHYVGSGGFLKHSDANMPIFNELEYEPTGDKCYHPTVDEKGEVLKRATSTSTGTVYLKVQFPGGITVVNEAKVRYQDVTNLPFTMNRQKIRVGRGIRGILGSAKVTFSDAQIEEFVNKYKSEIDKMNDIFGKFKLVKGDDIKHWYDESNYQHSGVRIGTLGSSCMRYDSCQKYFDIYTKNPDVCSLLILKTDDGEKIKARALIWQLSKPSGITFMDRVYTHADSDFDLFRQYAEEKGWYRRPTNDFNKTYKMLNPEGELVDMGHLSVIIKKGEYSYYPYIDTLNYFNPSGLLTTNKLDGEFELGDTDGSNSRISDNACDLCGGDGEATCPDCGGDGTLVCDDCGGDGEVTCGECDGDGYSECGSCSGRGKRDCVDCDGSGEDSEGEECNTCSGTGREECDDCEGSGREECSYCDGSGTEECSECHGRGRGEYDCNYCDGSGMVECPECT